MKPIKLSNHPDVVMIYQDREIVEPALQQIKELELEFKAFKYNPNKMHEIARMAPKVILLSSNNVQTTIQLYIDYLEEYEQNIAPHSAVLLISNRETYRSFLACENGLFDNYVIINPLNEPYRLKFVLLQELQIIESHKNNSLEILVSEGEDQLASCIEHGVALKKSFLHEVNKCSDSIDTAAHTSVAQMESGEAKSVLQNLIGLSFEEMNDNISAGIDNILDQLNELKLNNESLKQGIEKKHTPKKKTTVGVNTGLLTSTDQSNSAEQSSRFKILIAESSDLFTRVIDEIFSETVYKYVLVNDGQSALTQIARFKPDVVLLAYDLPTINGIEITRLIREEGNTLPIIAYTHHRDKQVIKEWIPLGLSGYLIKPSKKSAILKSVNSALSNPIEVILPKKNANKTEIQWSKAYSVGNKAMDEQHKELFSMVNQFFKQDDKQSAIILFESLASYIDLHFESEESLLRQINYPMTIEHIEEHQQLRQKFTALRKKLDNYDVDIHHKIAIFLYNWLAKHILKSDMEYKSYALSIEEDSFSYHI